MELGFTRYNMGVTTLQQIIDEGVSFPKEQINHGNKPELNKSFQIQIDAIESVQTLHILDSV